MKNNGVKKCVSDMSSISYEGMNRLGLPLCKIIQKDSEKMRQILIELQDVTLKRGRATILQDVQLSVARGEIVALIGGNGVGKTTLLSIVAGLLSPTSGTVNFPSGKPTVGWCGDKAALYPDWTVAMFLRWCAEMQLIDDKRLAVVVAQCGLETVLDLPCRVLSHGYRQRVSLAQALLALPDMLLLDEPSNGLDVEQRQSLRRILQTAANDTGILMIHHDIAEVLAVANRVYDLRGGRCIELPLPSHLEDWLWCEWETVEQAQADEQADRQIGVYTGYRFVEGDMQRVMMRLAQRYGVQSVSLTYPVSAFQTQREALWALV